jgi:hypothetical protein
MTPTKNVRPTRSIKPFLRTATNSETPSDDVSLLVYVGPRLELKLQRKLDDASRLTGLHDGLR